MYGMVWYGYGQVVHTGWLVKQGGRRKNWKRRWFAISANQIFYFKDPKDAVPLAAIQLFGNEVRVIPESQEPRKRFCFEIIPGGETKTMMTDNHRTFIMYAATKPEMETWLSYIRKECYAPRGGGMFGTDLAATLEREGRTDDQVPMVVEKTLNYLVQFGLKEEGLFRKSGLAARINKLKEQFAKGENPELDGEADVHVGAALFKMYLRELPEPLLTFQHHGEFIAAAQIYTDNAATTDHATLLVPVRALLSKLPPCNVTLLRFLCQFLRQVLVHEASNRMGIDNLATVFGPCLLRDRQNHDDPLTQLGLSKMINVVVKMFLQEFDILFSDLSVPKALPRSTSWRKTTLIEADLSDDSDDEDATARDRRSGRVRRESSQAESSPTSPTPLSPGPSSASPFLQPDAFPVQHSNTVRASVAEVAESRVKDLEAKVANLEERLKMAEIRYLEEWQTRQHLELVSAELQRKLKDYEEKDGLKSASS
ncbi:rho GTPase activating protein, variant 1 [Capsaspora owczarzaki ATCC 30864]|uniref:Rho GTPase activating protein, variant 1 n=1 Tax=Capsaspora owczarzaki (strain ATCC 30864) TaxID=595528 RepID=A0A0D2X3P0_CAPO3|nr:rho GTPase activating protein, variant 1 [Capsaspora owczarzaki ATCC 30864]